MEKILKTVEDIEKIGWCSTQSMAIIYNQAGRPKIRMASRKIKISTWYPNENYKGVLLFINLSLI